MAAATPKFHRLTVSDVKRETADAVSIAFAVPDELTQDYHFAAGQYLTLRATFAGEELRRSYSICSAPGDEALRIGVKRLDQGVFSTWLNTALSPGDRIQVMTPTGRFGLPSPRGDRGVYAGFAAGSGITPILSIMRDVLSRDRDSRFYLFYGNRSTDEILFRTEIEDLKDRFLSRLSVVHVLSREKQDVGVLNGRLDPARVSTMLRAMVPITQIDHALICGPTEMIDGLEALLRQLGMSASQVHSERFVSALGGRPAVRPVVVTGAAPTHTLAVIADGKRRDVPIAEGETVLDAALRAGMDLPFACKGGMCSTCRARVIEGAVRMDVNYSLEAWEVNADFTLTCQSHPTTSHVVIDFDQV